MLVAAGGGNGLKASRVGIATDALRAHKEEEEEEDEEEEKDSNN